MSILLAAESATNFLGLQVFELDDFIEIITRFAFNTFMLVALIRWLYYPVTRNRYYMFTFFMIGIIVFLLCFLLENVKLQIGMALGLFAIFGILRYRTIQISIKEMTYLFLVIGISVINALANKKISFIDILFTNLAVLGLTWLLETVLFRKPLKEQVIVYDKIEMITPEKREELIADLEKRTGLKIKKIELGRISFLRDSVRIRIFYYE